MRQKITIVFSVILLLAAVYLIAKDLFSHSASPSTVNCCGDDLTALKKIDTTLVGYLRINVIETGLKNLTGIAVYGDNSVFVCGNGRLNRFDLSGARLEEVVIDSVSSCITISGNDIFTGTGAGIVKYNITEKSLKKWDYDYPDGYITSLAVNDQYVYAADANRKLIMKMDLSGKVMLEIGKKDTITDSPGFILPSLYFDIAFGGFNDLWVSNTGRLRVEHYTASGYFQSDWGKASYEPGGFSGCCNPAHFAILPDGCFVTYEKGIDQLKVFDQTGHFLSYVGGAGSFRGNADFNLGSNQLVRDLATGTDGSIYILDAYNRINVFQKKKS